MRFIRGSFSALKSLKLISVTRKIVNHSQIFQLNKFLSQINVQIVFFPCYCFWHFFFLHSYFSIAVISDGGTFEEKNYKIIFDDNNCYEKCYSCYVLDLSRDFLSIKRFMPIYGIALHGVMSCTFFNKMCRWWRENYFWIFWDYCVSFVTHKKFCILNFRIK